MTDFTVTAEWGAGHSKSQQDTTAEGLAFDLTNWIVFGVEWNPTTISYLVQLTPSGPLTAWNSIANPDPNPLDPYSFAQKMFLALQLQTGDPSTPGNEPTITATNPIKQQHDWVQICVTP